MMRRFWAWLAVFLGKYAWWVMGVAAVITLVLAVLGVPRLDFATGQDSYLNSDEQIAIDNEEYQSLFGGQAMITLFTAEEGGTVLDLFSNPENLAQLEQVEEDLRAQTNPDGTRTFPAVIGPVTAMRYTQSLITPRDPATGDLVVDEQGNPVYASPADVLTSVASDILLGAQERLAAEGQTAEADARAADSQVTLARLAEALEGGTDLSNPEWAEFLLLDNQGNVRKALLPFFPFAPGVEPTLENAVNAQLVTRMGGNLSIEEEGVDSETVLDITGQLDLAGFETVTTGAPVLLKDINDYLQGGMLTLGGIAVVVMVVVLLVAFRVRWRLLSLGAVLFAVVWAFSILGIVGIPLALVTISGLPILIGIGIDLSIQVHNRVEEERVLDKDLHPIQETLVNLGPPLVIATLAGVAAFLGLQWSRVPMIRDFGVLLAIGITCSVIAAIVLMTAILGWREFTKPTEKVAPTSWFEKVGPKLGSLPSWWAVPFALASVVLLVGAVLLEDRFKIETDPERWVNQDSQVIEDLDLVRARTGSSSELGFFVKTADGTVWTDDTVGLVTEFATSQLEENPGTLLTASSVVTTVAFLMDVPGGGEPLPLGADVEAAWNAAPPDIQVATSADDGGALNLIFRTGPSSLEQRRDVVEEMDATLESELVERPQLTMTASGLAVVGIGLLNNLQANRAQLTYIALGLVAAWLLIRFLSVTKTVLAMVPILLAVAVSSLIVALVGITLSPMTTVSGPLIAAAVTEFAVLILTRYLEERRNGLEPRAASDHATARTGRAFLASALTTIGGFGVLVFSSLPLLRDFGIIVTINVTVALVVALTVLPPMLVFTDEKGWLKARRSTELP